MHGLPLSSIGLHGIKTIKVAYGQNCKVAFKIQLIQVTLMLNQ